MFLVPDLLLNFNPNIALEIIKFPKQSLVTVFSDHLKILTIKNTSRPKSEYQWLEIVTCSRYDQLYPLV